MGSIYAGCLDSIADKLESAGQLRLAKAVDQISERLETEAAFDEKRISGWSKVQESIIRAIEEVNKIHMRSGPDEKRTVNSVYDFLQQAHDACTKQFKS